MKTKLIIALGVIVMAVLSFTYTSSKSEKGNTLDQSERQTYQVAEPIGGGALVADRL